MEISGEIEEPVELRNWRPGDAYRPAGASREAAVQAYVSHLSYSSPELAAPWAETLTDPNTRNNQVENIARRWLEADRAVKRDQHVERRHARGAHGETMPDISVANANGNALRNGCVTGEPLSMAATVKT